MTDHYIKTDSAAVGPFSDVELRELAFAGLIKPETDVADSPEGPWRTAEMADLFSYQRLPVPHPPGTELTQFHVQGLPAAFQGPFKLRELVGFAVRGMLPPDAIVKSGASSDWIPALQIRVLEFCLNGDLAMLDPRGQLLLRASGNTAALNLEGARAPIEVAQQAAARRVAVLADKPATPAMVDEGYEAEQSKLRAASEAVKAAAAAQPKESEFTKHLKLLRGKAVVPDWVRTVAQPMQLMSLAAAILLIIAGGAALTLLNQPTPRQRVLGDWIGYVGNSSAVGRPKFGISLRADGTCVVFNSVGPSWTGEFSFEEQHNEERIYEKFSQGNSVVDTIEMHHSREQVQSTDGYIRFTGRNGSFPVIDGHPVREAFVRFGPDLLQLGYLAIVNWTPSVRILQAGWITANAAKRNANRSPIERNASGTDSTSTIKLPDTTEKSPKVSELLKTRGIPDEARTIYPEEIPESKDKSSLTKAQVVRYGTEKFLVMPDQPSTIKP